MLEQKSTFSTYYLFFSSITDFYAKIIIALIFFLEVWKYFMHQSANSPISRT